MPRELRMETRVISLSGATAIKTIEADIQTRGIVLPALSATLGA